MISNRFSHIFSKFLTFLKVIVRFFCKELCEKYNVSLEIGAYNIHSYQESTSDNRIREQSLASAVRHYDVN